MNTNVTQRRTTARELLQVVQDTARKKYAMTVFNFFLAIFLILFAVRPTLETVVKLRSEIAQKETTLATLEDKFLAIRELAAQYPSVKSDIDDLALIFPEGKDYSLIMTNINEISKARGYNLLTVGFADSRYTVTDNILYWQEATFNIQGDGENIIDLLRDFEKMPNYPEVLGLSVINVDGNGVPLEQKIYSVKLRFLAVSVQDFYLIKDQV